jgi:hypothetical protein
LGGVALGGGPDDVADEWLMPAMPDMPAIESEADELDASCAQLAAQPLTSSTAAPAAQTRNLTDTPRRLPSDAERVLRSQ